MGRRERLEARAEKRRQWAESRAAKHDQEHERARRAVDGIPFGQPVLVGHHSERRHRAALDRQHDALGRAVAHADMQHKHETAAAGIERQLSRSIFSDDENAAEECERKAAEIDAGAAVSVKVNAAWRKHGPRGKTPDADSLRAALVALGLTEAQISADVRTMGLCPWLKAPHFSGNARANARRYRERAKAIRAEAAKRANAEAAPGGVLIVEHTPGRVAITFPDYPGRETVAALKAAGFHWSRPSWYGAADSIPQQVRDMLPDDNLPHAADCPTRAHGAAPCDCRPDDVCPDGPTCADPACVAERARRAEVTP